MAQRVPLKLVSGELVMMTAADIANIKQQAIHLLAESQLVELSVTSSNNGNLNSMNDRRYAAGTASVSNTAFPADSEDIIPVDTTYNRLIQSVGTQADNWGGSAPERAFPLYYNAVDDCLQTMSKEDFYDTFIDTAIAEWVGTGGTGNLADGGQYGIFTTRNSIAGWRLQSMTAVFRDSRADKDFFATAPIPIPVGSYGAQGDEPEFVTNYYLHKKRTSAYSYSAGLYIDSNGDLQEYTTANFDAMLLMHMRLATLGRTGSTIRYQINTAANATPYRNLGTGMTDTELNSFLRRNQQSGDNYYTQEVPAGTDQTRETYYLNLIVT